MYQIVFVTKLQEYLTIVVTNQRKINADLFAGSDWLLELLMIDVMLVWYMEYTLSCVGGTAADTTATGHHQQN